MKRTILALVGLLSGGLAVATDQWQALTFGQSTDLNFSTNVLPSKVGVNRVTLNNGKVLPMGQPSPLSASFVIESRGGKLANSHDGITLFYRQIPADHAFVLEADMTLLQFGPENGKTPNGQEGAGLLVRDSVGPARLMPQPLGHEEFPHAANQLLNAALTTNKANDNVINLVSVQRDGVLQAWGNARIAIERKPYQQAIDYRQQPLRLRLERNAAGYLLSWFDRSGKLQAQQKTADRPGFLTTQDSQYAYVGFFAARNATAQFDHAKLTIGEKIVNNKLAPSLRSKQPMAELEQLSPEFSFTPHYVLQLRPNYAGQIVYHTKSIPAKAGEFIQLPTALTAGVNTLTVSYLPDEGPNAGNRLEMTFPVQLLTATVADSSVIYASANGLASNPGTLQAPVDVATALLQLQPGGTIWLADGQYPGFNLPASQSGLPQQPKRLQAINRHQVSFTDTPSRLNASYWILEGLVFDGNPEGSLTSNRSAFLRVAGSHNRLERLIARNNADTGFWISANGVHRSPSLWPAHNWVLNSDSYNNRDDSGINADGFAAKLGVGVGNLFDGCLAHHNADDGWDLFNKIEDGPNQPVTIINSVAYRNGLPFGHKAPPGTIGNGFKLGGEGQPVAHIIHHNKAIANNMDGFSDNFNTGSLQLTDNLAIDNARYNFIVRNNPYPNSTTRVTFLDNHSLRSQPHQLADFLGQQVNVIHSPSFTDQQRDLTTQWQSGVAMLEFSRDQQGKLLINKKSDTD
ncbi:right-handed parallel beta-helix repeat-containing protein [Serratia microhaemolytica]|uniref:right-handed parallel beta-helix repeat-containing protein n=1 Tax=Serratia microhaemolytica TaxID=2675110 RepID=UPI000FDD0AF7|nr:right-handed parallel beta-helix repeat-containing protein [Serratia microhaemolytica]